MSSVFDIVAKITLDTSEYNSNLDDAKRSGSNFGSAFSSGFKTIAGIGVKAITAATAAVAGFGAASVRTGMAFDTSMSQVAATLGKTVQEMEGDVQTVDLSWGKFTGNLREYAQEMGAHTAFSATQAADALNYMALAGYDTEKSMNMLPNVLNLAAAGAMDLAGASDMVTDTQTALGLSTERTGTLIDEMAKAASKTNTSVSQLGSAILTVGGTAKQLNGGFATMADGTKKAYDGTTELSAALGILADNGTKGSAAGTALRNIMTSISGSKFDTFKEMGVQAYDANGKMRSLKDILGDMNTVMEGMTDEQKTNLINKTFNARDLKNINALLATSTERWDEVTLALLDADGAAEEMANTQLDNLAGDVTLFKSALEGAQIAISDELSPSLRDFVKVGTEGLSGFTEKLKGGDFKGAIGEIGNSIGNLAAEIASRIPDAIEAGAMLLEGIGEGLAENADVIFESAGEIASTLFDGLVNGLSESEGIIAAGTQMVTNFAQGVTDSLPMIGQKAMELLTAFVFSLNTFIPYAVSAGVELIRNVGQGLVTGIPTFLQNVLPMVTSLTETLRTNASLLVDAGLEFILNLAQGIFDSLPILLEQIPDIVINIAGIINDNAPKVLFAGIQLIVSLAKGIVQAIPALIENIPKIFHAIVAVWSALNWVNLGKQAIKFIANGVKNIASQIPSALKSIGQKAINFFKGVPWGAGGKAVIQFILNAIRGMITAIPTLLGQIARSAMSAFTSIDWASVGKGIISGVVSGINAGIGWIKDAAINAAKSAVNAAKDILGINSPSKVFRKEVGLMIGQGMALGIDDSNRIVDRSMQRLNTDLLTGFDSLEIPTVSTMAGEVPTGDKAINITNYFTVNGADSPEDWATRLVRQMELEVRMA